MQDQAHSLRALMDQNSAEYSSETRESLEVRARTCAFTSGKGGVGKSCLALNVAVSLAQSGANVCLLDANLGLGNVDLMCGLNGYWNLSHVMTGARTVEEIMLQGPAGLCIVPGASGLAEIADCPQDIQDEILRQLERLENSFDYIILDTGAGISRSIRRFLQVSDLAMIVTTPEPTALADAYATIKSFSGSDSTRLCAVVNQAASREQALAILERLRHTTRTFLDRQIETVGWVPCDPGVPGSIWKRIPFVLDTPQSAATLAIHEVAHRIRTLAAAIEPQGFFARLGPRLAVSNH